MSSSPQSKLALCDPSWNVKIFPPQSKNIYRTTLWKEPTQVLGSSESRGGTPGRPGSQEEGRLWWGWLAAVLCGKIEKVKYIWNILIHIPSVLLWNWFTMFLNVLHEIKVSEVGGSFNSVPPICCPPVTWPSFFFALALFRYESESWQIV